jgi:transglutaminase-like putative cysteine protease
MGPIGPREEIQAAIEHTGCRVRSDPARGGMVAIDCPTYEARAALVDAMAWRDAFQDGAVRLLALDLTRDLASLADHEGVARRIHAAVRDRVRYCGEAGDVIQDPIVTWELAAGDCDCVSRLILALLRALGVKGALCAFLVDGGEGGGGPEVRHACATWERGPDDFVWLEATLPAEFGEHPMDAAARLYSDRTDLR